MDWISMEEKLPEAGSYRVMNEHSQTATSFWDGKRWQGWVKPQGSCMLYQYATITHYKPLPPN